MFTGILLAPSKQLAAFNISGIKRLMISGLFHSKTVLLVEIFMFGKHLCRMMNMSCMSDMCTNSGI